MIDRGIADTKFREAYDMYEAALERLAVGDIRDAAEKAWCSTLIATNALIVARGGKEPEKSPATSRALKELAAKELEVRTLVDRYYSNQAALHGECFYLGFCDPVEATASRIRETAKYIDDAARLARNEQ